MSWLWLIAVPGILVALVFGVAAERADGAKAKRRMRIAIGASMMLNLAVLARLLAE